MRALILVMDSVGIGAAPDAAAYGDTVQIRSAILPKPALWGRG
jgi:phosphopentomutase